MPYNLVQFSYNLVEFSWGSSVSIVRDYTLDGRGKGLFFYSFCI
jgi:hypothetical protein